MKVISFFSGAGGMDLGFMLAGHKIVWSNDFDAYANQTYSKNLIEISNHKLVEGDIVNYLNISGDKINKKIPNGEIVIGGFPCQGFSIANVGRSMNDERNFLYEQLLKVISAKQPDYFLLENVKGLENMQKGKVLSMILDDLEAAGTAQSKFFPGTKEGYRVAYNIFNALDYGVPQNRERIIILGVRKDKYENSPVSRYFDNSIAHRSRYDHRKTLKIPYTHSKSSNLKQDYTPLEIINLMYKDLLNNNPVSYPLKGDRIYSHTTLRDVISDLPEDFDESITNHVGSFCKVNIKNTVGNRATDWNRHAPTIMGRGSGTGGPLIPPHPNKKRRLSVRETARIQTFPDKFEFHGSNSAAYRQIGNAVPVIFAYKIAEIFKIT